MPRPRELTVRPIVIHVRRDLAEMSTARIVEMILSKSPHLARDYRDQVADIDVDAQVVMVPRNRVELWPARKARVVHADGWTREVLVSIDENSKPVVILGAATPLPASRSNAPGPGAG